MLGWLTFIWSAYDHFRDQGDIRWSRVLPYLALLPLMSFGIAYLWLSLLRYQNGVKRDALVMEMGFGPNSARAKAARAKGELRGDEKLQVTLAGFWHPYCNAGGGGERVLWTAIAWLQRERPNALCVVYTGDQVSKEEIVDKVKSRFQISLDPTAIHLVFLPRRELISDGYWKRFTLLGQSLGSVLLAWPALTGKDGLWCDVIIDTMGYACIFPLIRLLGGRHTSIGAYVHYPTISTDMIDRVRSRKAGVTNEATVAQSMVRTQGKLLYYRIFARIYALALSFADSIVANGTWTNAHVTSLLDLTSSGRRSRVLFPPCDTQEFVQLRLEGRKPILASLAQFRPEKDHATQILALARLFEEHPEWRERGVKMWLMGSSRNEGDDARIKSLRKLCVQYDVEDFVEFVVNASFPEIVSRLGQASVGMNTMVDEHFGISVVEFMAAGLIPLVHASAGPLLDIVVPWNGQKTGWHATDVASFATGMHEILSLSTSDQSKIRSAARSLAKEKFSQRSFEMGWSGFWDGLTRRS